MQKYLTNENIKHLYDAQAAVLGGAHRMLTCTAPSAGRCKCREGHRLEYGLVVDLQMRMIDHIRDFLDAFVNCASAQEDVQAVALVGSYARGEARDDSDIDLVLLTNQPQKYLEDLIWIERFGAVEKHQTEDYGRLISVRVWYQNGVEVEYGITTPDWAVTPLDAGTQQVIRGGMIVLFERGDYLSRYTKI